MISLKDAAEKLGVTERRLRVLCAEGRVIGAKKIGGSWILPSSPQVVAGSRTRPGVLKVKKKK